MYFILKLIILFEIYSSCHMCKAYVLETTQQDDNISNDLNENKLTDTGTTDPFIYIDNMVRPGERESANMQEIIDYVGVEKFSNTAALPEPDPETAEQQETLTYTELSKLLAFWQWAKEQNFYKT